MHNPLFPIGALEFIVVGAQQQARTIRDVKVRWVRPRVPSKKNGRRGTRKAWKRRNAPHWVLAYREPEDVLRYGLKVIVTPRQYEAIKQHPSIRST